MEKNTDKNNDSNFLEALENLKLKRKRRWKTFGIILLSIALAVAISVIFFQKQLARTGAALSGINTHHMFVRDSSVADIPVSDGFCINIAELREYSDFFGKAPFYNTTFGYKENNRWKYCSISENAGCLVRFSHDVVPYFGYSFLSRVGEYTVIAISPDDIAYSGLTKADVYDSLGTQPVLVGPESIPNPSPNSCWYSDARREDGSLFVSTTSEDLSTSCYFYVLRGIPADYCFYYGDSKLDAQQIEELLRRGNESEEQRTPPVLS